MDAGFITQVGFYFLLDNIIFKTMRIMVNICKITKWENRARFVEKTKQKV